MRPARPSGGAVGPEAERSEAVRLAAERLRRAWPVVAAALTERLYYPTRQTFRQRTFTWAPLYPEARLVTLRIGLDTNSPHTTTARLVGWRKIARTPK